MQLNQIRYFLALCAERNFTRAAVRLGVAQPTVTNGIRALEQSLGGRLFYRRRQVVLTALGEAVYPYLSRIIDSVDLACAAAASLSAEQLANNQAVASPSEKPLAPVGRAEVNGLRRAL
jgi:LysR family transcriptional regulator, hydrogen peroxide-inducible genes activator